ncbi:deoxyribonuclease II family protein [Bradyrhizobium sp. RT11b]|uniref:deoxyribonuclease II family protein n=1 Tax=Bradyrhizobium sp. RT11b TaxID=3156332 RepID=UPI003399BE2D
MGRILKRTQSRRFLYSLFIAIPFVVSVFTASGNAQSAPAPLLQKGASPVDWWFIFKFNTKFFPGCEANAKRACIFGGNVQDYPKGFGLQSISASSANPTLHNDNGCLGESTDDPIGATFDEIYNGTSNYVIWNDQFYDDPDLPACKGKTFCDAPWGHSKGVLAWNDQGDGLVMQVSTPNWPGSGSPSFSRNNGNTLGCITDNKGKPQNNVWVSQHFFALRLNKSDVVAVLRALQRASVVTQADAKFGSQSQIIRNGGPDDIQKLVSGLGQLSDDSTVLNLTLSSGVQIISKPPNLHVPPWQMVSAVLGGVPLTVATWLTGTHKIGDTKAGRPGCWDPALGTPGAVTNADSGTWMTKVFGLTGGASADRNHAKIGISTPAKYAIFGDLNQEGALSEPCTVSQNTRGGIFFAVENPTLSASLGKLMDVDEAFKLAFISAARFSSIPSLIQAAAKAGVQLEKPMIRPAAQKR